MRQHNHSISFSTASKGIIYEHLSTRFTHRSKIKRIISLTRYQQFKGNSKWGEKDASQKIMQQTVSHLLAIAGEERQNLCALLVINVLLYIQLGLCPAKGKAIRCSFIFYGHIIFTQWQSFLWVISVSDQVSFMLDIISGLRFKSMAGKKLKWNIYTWEAILQVFFSVLQKQNDRPWNSVQQMLSSLVIYMLQNSTDCWYLANFLIYGWLLKHEKCSSFSLDSISSRSV